MKQILLFASAIALMTSCAKQDTGTSNAVPNFEGVAFNAVAEGQGETKAEWTAEGEQWLMNWYAEQDKVSVFYKQALLGTTGTGYGRDWSAGTVSDIGAATYKATRTEKGGYFTANAATDILNWSLNQTTDAAKAASFIVTWPAITLPAITNTVTSIPVPVNGTQTQSDLNGASTVKNVFMVTAPKALDDVAPVKNGSASDALINMTLTRPFPVAYFKLKNYDKGVFGEFKSITLETKGSTAPATVVAASTITFDQAAYDATKTPNAALTDVGTPVSKITLNMIGLAKTEWTDASVAYMAISNVDRTKFATAPETVEVVYEFQYGSVKDEFTTKANWFGSAAGGRGFINMSSAGTAIDGAFDLMSAPYLVLNSNKTLIINETCNLSIAEIVAKESLTASVITKLVAHVVLTQADFDYMGKNFTGCADVTLMKNTEIPAFDVDANAVALTSVVAPLVSKIDQLAFNKQGGALELKTCILPSYDFANVNVADALLKTNYLEVADLSGVATFSNKFPKEGLSLQGFINLETLTVKNGVAVGTKAFDGCTALQRIDFPEGTVDGSIILTAGPGYAFNNCSGLSAISVSSTEIPDGTFNGCTLLKDITSDGKTAIVPTKIGAQAFQGTDIVDMDLSKAATIGKEAFKTCTDLVGTHDEAKGINILNVDAITVVEEGVFSGCIKLEYIGFAKANKVNTKFLENTVCNEISFDQVITGADNMDVKSFGIVADILSGTTLFVNGGQVVNGSTLTLGATGKTASFIFKAIK